LSQHTNQSLDTTNPSFAESNERHTQGSRREGSNALAAALAYDIREVSPLAETVACSMCILSVYNHELSCWNQCIARATCSARYLSLGPLAAQFSSPAREFRRSSRTQIHATKVCGSRLPGRRYADPAQWPCHDAIHDSTKQQEQHEHSHTHRVRTCSKASPSPSLSTSNTADTVSFGNLMTAPEACKCDS
jgi:hypothetical protein